jgi:hypothetical protein
VKRPLNFVAVIVLKSSGIRHSERFSPDRESFEVGEKQFCCELAA